MNEQKLLEWWLPPEGAGDPIGCIATSFTFDTDFFRDDCLGRFIGLRGAIAEEGAGTLAQVNELEERLSDVSACVIVDRSASIEGRNLRWDVLTAAVEGGLMHAKTALLVWEDAARIIIGSANLTPAGYRRNREFAVAYELAGSYGPSREFWRDYVEALEYIVALTPEDFGAAGPRGRAESVLDVLRHRVETLAKWPETSEGRAAIVLSRPGKSVPSQLPALMDGAKPRTLVAMSPYWDEDDQGSVDAIRELTSLLAQRGVAEATFLVPLEVTSERALIRAPMNLGSRVARTGIKAELAGVADGQTSGEQERRRLHAKALLLKSEDWLTFMWGSSNMTSSGLGLHPRRGHVELNVAYGAPAASRLARALESLIPDAFPLPDQCEAQSTGDAEEEPTRASLPLGFVSALLERRAGVWCIHMRFDLKRLPKAWTVRASGLEIASSQIGGVESLKTVQLSQDTALPQSLQVAWNDAADMQQTADWVLNVANPADLPLNERLRAIPIDAVVQALAQRRTDPAAFLERLLDRISEASGDEALPDLDSPLDPLRAFDDSRALLKRMAIYGRALDQLQAQLSRPVPTLSALGWRLTGLISPTRLADGWAEQAASGELPAEVAHFLFAELQLVMRRVPWSSITQNLDQDLVRAALEQHQEQWEVSYLKLPPLPLDHGVHEYVKSARMSRS